MSRKHENTDIIVTNVTKTIKKVVFNRPNKKNAITTSMYNELIDILDESSKCDGIHALVFSGAGDCFTSGNDFISAITNYQGNTLQAMNETTMTFKKFVDAIIKCPKLLIAVVNGPAIGIGATMLGLFDIVYASDKAYFQTPFSAIGVSAEGCSTYTFPRIMGMHKAGEMLYLGYKMSATEAKQCGFVNQIYNHNSLDDVWTQIAKIPKLSTESIHVTKRLIRKWDEQKLLDVNDEEVKELLQRWDSPDFIARITSVLSRRSKL